MTLKILAAGDIHGDKQQAELLAEKAKREGVDLVILTGDLTFFEQDTSGIVGPFKKRGIHVLLIPGNHETLATADFLAELYKVRNIHGCAVIYKGVGIVGVGGSNVGPNFMLTEQEIWETIKKGFTKLNELKKHSELEKVLLVTHTHPSGTLMEKMGKFIKGSTAIRKAIEYFNPDLVLCSHVHEAEGLEEKIGKTKVINVGRSGRVLEL